MSVLHRVLRLPDDYSRHALFSDLAAGTIVAVVAMPLCIAFAIASGVSPEKGLFTAVIAGIAVALFSGSKVQIAGPSGPFVVIAFGIITQFGPERGPTALIIATFGAGLLLLVMGWTGMGMLIKFIPYPVIAGFTSGVALILITTEVKDFFGLNAAAHGTVVANWLTYFGALKTVNWNAAAVGAGTILVLVIFKKLLPRIPASIVALIAATAAVQIFSLPVDTIGNRFTIPRGIPVPQFPHLDFELLREMVEPATAIALLAAIEALLAAVVGEGLSGITHDPNRVLVGQGIGNIASAVFGCLPATAAIARTATNVRNGARTPVAGLTHSFLLLLVLLLLGRWASLIPLACLAGILVHVAVHLLDLRGFISLLKNPRSDVLVLLATLAITVLVDLKTGVLIGMVMAAALFVHSMSSATHVSVVTREFTAEKLPGDAVSTSHALPPGVEVYEINGPFFFGAVHKLKEVLTAVSRKPKVRILRMARVNVMDSTGLHALEDIHRLCRKQHAEFLIAEIHAQPYTVLIKSGLLERFGEKNVLASFEDALQRTREILDQHEDPKA